VIFLTKPEQTRAQSHHFNKQPGRTKTHQQKKKMLEKQGRLLPENNFFQAISFVYNIFYAAAPSRKAHHSMPVRRTPVETTRYHHITMTLTPIGHIRSTLRDRTNAPRQTEGSPAATLEILPAYASALEGLQPSQEIWILTWLHQADRDTLRVHPGSDPRNPIAGVFATRSPDRPNPIGLHRATLLRINGLTLHIQAIEAIDQTPILDIKPVLKSEAARDPSLCDKPSR
jgi:tRNA-Thr(GGU) m(6)t(6)A37 methyltransferase TsaA